MSRKAKNLAEIWHRFDTETFAAEAITAVAADYTGDGEWDMEDLLRHHEDLEVDDIEEVAMRDNFDGLLAFYGCVEIASIIGFVPARLPSKFRSEAAMVLGHPDVRRYYRRHYPLLLPDMLFARVTGTKAHNEAHSEGAMPLFFEFLHINGILENDENVDMFLWFLDDGYHEGHDWETTLEILAKPERLIKALKRRLGDQNPSQQAIDGFQKFLSFCIAFDDLLSRSRQFELMQAAMWHYHAYWFRNIKGEVRKDLDKAFARLKRWLSSRSAKQLTRAEAATLKQEAEASLRNIREVVGRLTGTRYGRKLTRARRKIRNDSAAAIAP